MIKPILVFRCTNILFITMHIIVILLFGFMYTGRKKKKFSVVAARRVFAMNDLHGELETEAQLNSY